MASSLCPRQLAEAALLAACRKSTNGRSTNLQSVPYKQGLEIGTGGKRKRRSKGSPRASGEGRGGSEGGAFDICSLAPGDLFQFHSSTSRADVAGN